MDFAATSKSKQKLKGLNDRHAKQFDQRNATHGNVNNFEAIVENRKLKSDITAIVKGELNKLVPTDPVSKPPCSDDSDCERALKEAKEQIAQWKARSEQFQQEYETAKEELDEKIRLNERLTKENEDLRKTNRKLVSDLDDEREKRISQFLEFKLTEDRNLKKIAQLTELINRRPSPFIPTPTSPTFENLEQIISNIVDKIEDLVKSIRRDCRHVSDMRLASELEAIRKDYDDTARRHQNLHDKEIEDLQDQIRKLRDMLGNQVDIDQEISIYGHLLDLEDDRLGPA